MLLVGIQSIQQSRRIYERLFTLLPFAKRYNGRIYKTQGGFHLALCLSAKQGEQPSFLPCSAQERVIDTYVCALYDVGVSAAPPATASRERFSV